MSRTKKIIIGAVAVAGVLAILAFSLNGKDRNLPKVTTAKVEKVDLVSKVTANGKVQSRRKVDLSALVMGQIVNLAVQEGDQVKKGQFLLQIDRVQLAAQAAGREASLLAIRKDLEASKSNADQAQRDYERAKTNYEAKILPEADYQHARAAWEAATATLSATEHRVESTFQDLAASKDSLSKTTVTAPIGGVVTALPIKEGEVTVIGTMNNAGTQMLTISDMSEVEAVMMVDETSVPQVKVGQKANLNVDAYPNRKFTGTVTEVGSSPISKTDPDLLSLTANSEAINFKVKIRLDEPPDTIRPGFSVTAEIVTGRVDGASAIPIQALVVRDVPKKGAKGIGQKGGDPGEKKASTGGRPETEEGVYFIKDSKVGFQKVETGIAGDLMIEIKGGPKVGDQIVTGPFKVLRQIKEGDKVLVENDGDKKGKKDDKAAS
jgi:HlyD family secretion protein